MYFYTLFHPHVFSKNINNVTRITLPNFQESLKQYCSNIMKVIIKNQATEQN